MGRKGVGGVILLSLFTLYLPLLIVTRDGGSSLCFMPSGRGGRRTGGAPIGGRPRGGIIAAGVCASPNAAMMIRSHGKGGHSVHSISRCGHHCSTGSGRFTVRSSALCMGRGTISSPSNR